MRFRRMLYLKIARMSRGSNTPVPSIISFGTKIKGNILGGDVLHVDGMIEGNIVCEELIIGSKGHIYGQVKAKTLTVYGFLQGSSEAETVMVAKGARVIGDIMHQSIAVEPGALIDGRCVRMAKTEAKPEPETKHVAKANVANKESA